MAVGGIVALALPIYWMLTQPPQATMPVEAPAVPQVGVDWGLLAGLVLILFSGLYLLVKPRIVIEWGKRTMPHRIVSDAGYPRGFLVVRLLGALFVIYTLYVIARMFMR